MPSTPQSKRRRISASSLTVQTWTAQRDRWAPRRKRRETTRSRPDTSGNWNARYGTRAWRHPEPGALQRAKAFVAPRARGDVGGRSARRGQDRGRERPEADAMRGAGATDGVHDCRAEPRVLSLHFDNQRGVPVTRQHRVERGYASRWRRTTGVPGRCRIGGWRSTAGQLGGGAFRHTPGPVRRPFQRAIMNDDHLPVARQVHVEFQAVSAGCDAGIEGHQRVLGSNGASTAMREHERNPVGECGRRRHVTAAIMPILPTDSVPGPNFSSAPSSIVGTEL